MANREQQTRRKVRDRTKHFEGVISSINSTRDPQFILSRPTIMKVVEQAHDMNLSILALIGLEALKVYELEQANQIQRAYIEAANLLAAKLEQEKQELTQQLEKLKHRFRVRAPTKKTGRALREGKRR